MNGAWVLPRTDQHEALFSQLADGVREQDGSATVLTTQGMTRAEGDSIIARFRADRGREYTEFAERAQGFFEEIEKETRLGKFTFAELEEIEDDFEKLSAWLSKIRARDFFPDHRQQDAEDTLERCSKALVAFAETVYAQEGIDGPSDGAMPEVDENGA